MKKSSNFRTGEIRIFKFPRAFMAVPSTIYGSRVIPNGMPCRRLTLKGCKRPTARTVARNARRIAFANAHGLTDFLTLPVPA